MLSALLDSLCEQTTNDLFTYSVLIVDNDLDMSAEEVSRTYREKSTLRIVYYVERTKGIPFARNRAITEARGSLLAFIDDDEIAGPTWLATLHEALYTHQVAGALGPVKPRFITPPPEWIQKSRFFERPMLETGTVLEWSDTRTGNVLIWRSLFEDAQNRFDVNIGHGEDKDFFRRMMLKGHRFIWSNEAVVYEIEPPERFRRSYFLKRALVRGSYYFARATNKPMQIGTSLVTLCVHCMSLPIVSLFGQHHLMRSLVKICDHAGCIIGAFGIRPDRYFEHG